MGTKRTTAVSRAAGRAALGIGLAGALAACGSVGGSATGDVGAFEGEDLELVVPYEPGGGYDVYARAIAPSLEECLGARVIVLNEPGASGLVATNKTAAAPASANRIQIVNTVGLVSARIADAEGANFDLSELSWIGRVSAPPNVLVVAADSPVKDFQDIVDAEKTVRFVAQGPGANDYIAPNVVGSAYGYPFKTITGFAGSSEARTAIVAGNADAHVLPVDSQLPAIKAGDVRPIVTIDEEPDPLLPDTPTIYETEPPSDEARSIIDDLVAMGRTGRSLAASPKMDKERLAALREGFQCAADDQALVEEMKEQQRPFNPLGGEETARLVDEVLGASEEFQKLIRRSY